MGIFKAMVIFGIWGARPHFVLIRYTPPRAVLHFLPLNKYAHCLNLFTPCTFGVWCARYRFRTTLVPSSPQQRVKWQLNWCSCLCGCVLFLSVYNNTHTVYHINRLSVFRPVAEALFLKTHWADCELDGPVVFLWWWCRLRLLYVRFLFLAFWWRASAIIYHNFGREQVVEHGDLMTALKVSLGCNWIWLREILVTLIIWNCVAIQFLLGLICGKIKLESNFYYFRSCLFSFRCVWLLNCSWGWWIRLNVKCNFFFIYWW